MFFFFLWFEQSNTSISGSRGPFSRSQRGVVPRAPCSLKIAAAAVNSNRDRNGSVLMENQNTLKEMREEATALETDSKPAVAGGVHDVYGEDAATEDQFVTPWALSVARCVPSTLFDCFAQNIFPFFFVNCCLIMWVYLCR